MSAIRYYDTSAVLPLYLSESSSQNAQDALVRDKGQLVTSVITLIELRSGLARYERERLLTSPQAEMIFNRVRHDLDRTPRRLELTQEVRSEALRILKAYTQYPIRTLDVLHIATCLRYGTGGFVTNDKQQARLAQAVGLGVTWLGGTLKPGNSYE